MKIFDATTCSEPACDSVINPAVGCRYLRLVREATFNQTYVCVNTIKTYLTKIAQYRTPTSADANNGYATRRVFMWLILLKIAK